MIFRSFIIYSLQENSSVNISLLSREVRDKLNLIKYETKNYYVDLLRLKKETEDGRKVDIPSDLVKALDIGNSTDFGAADIESILKQVIIYLFPFISALFTKLRERQDAIDREEIAFLNEVEVMKVLERWEAHVNDTTAARQMAQRDFDLKRRKHPKSGRFHEPVRLFCTSYLLSIVSI